MMKLVGILLLLLVVGAAVISTAQPAAAQAQTGATAGEYQDVSGIVPFSAAANFMSLAGYLRLTAFRENGVWLSRAEAQRIVTVQQG